MKVFRFVSLASLLLLFLSTTLFAQTVTMRGNTSSFTVPSIAEPFTAGAQKAQSPQGPIQQPSLEKSLPPSSTASGTTQQATVQTQSLTSPGTTLGVVFDVQQGHQPPDSAIASGPDHVLTVINSAIHIFDKSGTELSSATLLQFFSSLPNSGNCCFDPRATYDQNHGRFIIAAAAVDSITVSHIFIAVSQTSDATGTWFKYDLSLTPQTPEGDPASVDFPTLGVSNGLLLLSANLTASNFQGTESSSVWVLQLAPLLAGNSTFSVTTFNDVKLPSGGKAFTIQPAITYGTPGVAYLAATDGTPEVGGNSIHLYTVPETATPTLTGVDVPVAAYKVIAGAPQPRTTTQLTAGGDVLSSSPVWRNGSLWVAHSVADPTGTVPVVRWYEVLTSNKTVRQTGTLSGAGAAFFPSITVTASGATDIVFLTSSSIQFASPTFAHREASDPLGEMPVQAIYQNGLAHFTADGGRFGDYTAIIADPDGVSSWTLAEYPTSISSYRLSGAHLLSSASAPPPPTGCAATAVGVNICSPAAGSGVTSPFTLSAASLGNARITGMKAYANGLTVASNTSSALNAQISLANATYNLVVKAWDSTGAVYQKSESITVGGPPPATCSISTVGVKICSPAAGSTISSPVQITAAAKGTNNITGMKAYANGVTVASSTGETLNAKVTLGAGTYTLTVKGWESNGTVHQTSETFTVH